MSGRVSHFELPYDDGDRARDFYTKVFGWQTMVMPDGEYTLVATGPGDEEGNPTEPGFIGGGLMKREEPFLVPNVIIEVDNIEDTLQAVNDAGGGTVSERQAVGDMGFVAYFKDPEGNLLGIWENAVAG